MNKNNSNNYIPLSIPSIQGNEWKYIKECLDTEWVSSAGKYVSLFEEKICEFTGSKYAVACVNGTSALQMSLLLSGVRPGDEVIVPTLTFIAPVNVVKYLGAEPVFMDCDDYYNINVDKVVDFLKKETRIKKDMSIDDASSNGWYTFNKKTGRKISAIIPVHVFGNAVELEMLVPICRERNIKIIEDATESLGTFYKKGIHKGKYTGTVGDFGCYSFNGNKIITTGGGGMIVTNNKYYADRARYLTTQAKDDEVRYIHNDIGYNFRLTNIQAALGVAQMEQLAEFLKIKAINFELYKREIKNIPGLDLAEPPDYAKNNHWMYPLQIDKEIYGKNREELMTFLLKNNIQTRPVWYLNHLQKPYRHSETFKIEKAIDLWERTLNIPCSTSLTELQISLVCTYLRKGAKRL